MVIAASLLVVASVVHAISGVVLDQTGAVMPSVTVELATADTVIATTTTNDKGEFTFADVPAGTYAVRVSFTGFETTTTPVVKVTTGSRAPKPLRITMPLARVTQELTVDNGSTAAGLDTDAARNADAITIDRAMLDSLPTFDRDVVGALSPFLDTGASGMGSPTIIVNGVEVDRLNVSPSAIQQIQVNQDPYAAEYRRPGRGRISIITRPGAQAFRGDGSFVFRDARLDARNAFADQRAPETRRIGDVFLGGPVGRGGKTSFTVSSSMNIDRLQAIVFAVDPSGSGSNAGTIREVVPQRERRLFTTGGLTHQHGDATTIQFGGIHERAVSRNLGVGGTTLPSAGSDFRHDQTQLLYTQQTIIGRSWLNQFDMAGGAERWDWTSFVDAPAIVVAGAFTGGGAQNDRLRTEHHLQFRESLTWTHARHLVQAGFQVPDVSRWRVDDRTQFGGTFSFASLDAYRAGRPFAFVQQQGNGDVAFVETVLGAYIKDDWRVGRGLTLSMGLRYDWQNHLDDRNNVAPRFSFAYAPGGDKKTTVIRGGIGLFSDRLGPGAIGEVLHFRPDGLRRIVITNPGYPDPFQGDATAAMQPPSVARFAPDLRMTSTTQFSLGVERRVRKGTTMVMTYTGARDAGVFRSRDVNAPSPPAYASRPDPAYGAIREIESTGRLRSDALTVSVRGTLTRWFNGQAQYTLSRIDNDTSGLASFPANDYDLMGEWARADFDRRHRLVLIGRVAQLPPALARIGELGVSLNVQSGTPYTETLGADIFNNGRGNARPLGVARNSLEGGSAATLDLRLSRAFTLRRAVARADAHAEPTKVTFTLDAFNVLNRVNYSTYIGTVTSPFFGQPIAARAPRQLQLTARLAF